MKCFSCDSDCHYNTDNLAICNLCNANYLTFGDKILSIEFQYLQYQIVYANSSDRFSYSKNFKLPIIYYSKRQICYIGNHKNMTEAIKTIKNKLESIEYLS